MSLYFSPLHPINTTYQLQAVANAFRYLPHCIATESHILCDLLYIPEGKDIVFIVMTQIRILNQINCVLSSSIFFYGSV